MHNAKNVFIVSFALIQNNYTYYHKQKSWHAVITNISSYVYLKQQECSLADDLTFNAKETIIKMEARVI